MINYKSLLHRLLLGHFEYYKEDDSVEWRWRETIALRDIDPKLHDELVAEYKAVRFSLRGKKR